MYPYLLEGWVGEYALMPSYGIALAMALTLAYLETIRQSLLHQEDPKPLEGLFATVLFSAAIGARLFHVVFEEWGYYWANPWHAFFLWEGGFALYGGLLFGIGGVFAYCRWKKLPALRLLDRATPGTLLGIAIGRVGCFAAGCCWGTPTSMPWGVRYLHRHALTPLRDVPLHPVQLYEALFAGLLFWLMARFAKRNPVQGNVFLVGLGVYSLGRFFLEFFRGDEIRGSWGPFSTGQGIALVIVAGVAAALMRRGRLPVLWEDLRLAIRPKV